MPALTARRYSKLGIEVAVSTVARYMVRERKPTSPSWRVLGQPRQGPGGDRLLAVPTATSGVLFGFLVLAHDRRRVLHFNVTANPSAERTARQVVQALPRGKAPRYLVRARDRLMEPSRRLLVGTHLTCKHFRSTVVAAYASDSMEGDVDWYLKVLKNYAIFTGRARRTEFWMFALINLLISLGLALIGAIIGGRFVLQSLYSLAVLIPSLAVSVRRLHDTNRTGWWMLIGLIPLVGAIVLLVFAVQDSQVGDNQYGPNPKAAPAASA